MKGKFSFVLLLLFAMASQPVFAVSTPSLTSCTNPQGSTIASYDSGTHGIVGDAGTHTGKDSVYLSSETQYLQCFCGDNSGIQTNWIKASSYTDTDITVLKKQGWIYVPNGSLWGLSSDPYIARNTSYSCTSQNASSGTIEAAVLSASTKIASSLATTGNSFIFYGLLGLGVIFFLAGLIIRTEEK